MVLNLGALRSSSVRLQKAQMLTELKKILNEGFWNPNKLKPDVSLTEVDSEVNLSVLKRVCQLTALPFPEDEKSQLDLLRNLKTRIHFAKSLQRAGVNMLEPLRSMHDENLSPLEKEDAFITFDESKKEVEDQSFWQPVAQAQSAIGNLFILKRNMGGKYERRRNNDGENVCQ